MVFGFGSVYVVNYVDRLVYVEPDLHPRDETYLIMMFCCCWFTSILLKIFASMLIVGIGLKFSFFVESLLGFGIRYAIYDVGLIK